MNATEKASGKLILSGEYAVVFGHPGIAIPIPFTTQVTYHENKHYEEAQYIQKIKKECETFTEPLSGTFTVESAIPIGRGLGSSTALVIAIARCLSLTKEQALSIEDTINPGHSGIDFETIWQERPLKFVKGHRPEPVDINLDFLENTILIDTGKPNETTPELVKWVKDNMAPETYPFQTIAHCTKRLLQGESPLTVFPDHHRAQIALGVVPKEGQKLITEIESVGGVAKVLGAGGRTGGGGMVLAVHSTVKNLEKVAQYFAFPIHPLQNDLLHLA
ncbi:hypothetical protein COU77_02770 [Candidatus Peregrinibacteria bacterium CG10_big_fil_rev_8_21_14_0_10_49_16]|nr:MAG: hypothetical protein COW95_02280 [Candidatus Peregrinibacteria bacterium CG22_combo_CG10-13_8_21_14_all_49_11]PIR51961.1 MAG: hypothetical protein COU77_02770 [Candidatus Peregrinibacteria bacterium CG10_big_fil_rev_8_21_14_0_10_49_16]